MVANIKKLFPNFFGLLSKESNHFLRATTSLSERQQFCKFCSSRKQTAKIKAFKKVTAIIPLTETTHIQCTFNNLL